MALYDVSTSEKKSSPSLVAGGTLYADSPIATILPYGGATAPSGWFLCQGQAISRTTYAELFAVIGTSFGAGDGSTTFNIPDLRGEFLRGAGTNSHSGQGNGGTVGDHQDATTVPNVYKATGGDQVLVASGVSALFQNEDASVAETSGSGYATITMSKSTSTDVPSHYMARPTNTSVNYIIKVKMVAVPADFMAKVQPKTLDTPLTIGGTSQTTVEGALGGLNSAKQNSLSNSGTDVNSYGNKDVVLNNNSINIRRGLHPIDDFPSTLSGQSGQGTTAAYAKALYDYLHARYPGESCVCIGYNYQGEEYTVIVSMQTTGNYGSVVRFGYKNTSAQIIRRESGSWKDDDWVNM